MSLRYFSVCSGIEAASVAWAQEKMRPVGFAEIDSFCCALLKHHYPNIENFGDITKITGEEIDGRVDVLIGGTPCQSFSVAGQRGGLQDARGALTMHFVRLVQKSYPKWVIWENVPGVLSSAGGQDFYAFLFALGRIGYSCAWRVLDAQFFGVPQRRRRVYVVASSGDWRRGARVLFEQRQLQSADKKSREKSLQIAGTLTASIGRSRGSGYPPELLVSPYHMHGCISSQCMRPKEHSGGNGFGVNDGSVCYTLTAKDRHSVAYAEKKTHIRRLTPLECERLQGFPDDYTLVPYRGALAKDTPRYKALGNSMAVPVIKWIGKRILQVEEI